MNSRKIIRFGTKIANPDSIYAGESALCWKWHLYIGNIETRNLTTASPFLYKVLALSIVLHLGIGYLIFQGQYRPQTMLPDIPQARPIQARLVFAPAEKITPDPVHLNEQEQVATAINEAAPLVKETDAPKVERQSEIESPIPLTPQFPQPEIDTRRADLPQISSPSLSEKGIAPRDLARHHLRDFNINTNNALAQQEAERFRQQQKSPDIEVAIHSDPILKTTRVNCSSGLNKTIAVLSAFTGGNLDCSKTPSLTPYIDKHLNKGVSDNQN